MKEKKVVRQQLILAAARLTVALNAALAGGIDSSALFGVASASSMMADVIPSRSQPLNLGDIQNLEAQLRSQLVSYHDNGYERDLLAVSRQAKAYLDEHLSGVQKPAIILDIDETSLSNWEEMKANNFDFVPDGPCDKLPAGPCGLISWDKMARAPAIDATLSLFKYARSRGVSVFFITGRHNSERSWTELNLSKAGYIGWSGVIMREDGSSTRSAADFKAPQRAKLEAEGYHILETVGDQPSDLAGGFADEAFLLPNPFYRIQ